MTERLNWTELKASPCGTVVKNLPANAGDASSIPGSGRSPGVENGNPFQYSCLENPMDKRAWWATAHGVTKSRTQLSIHTHIWSMLKTGRLPILSHFSGQNNSQSQPRFKVWRNSLHLLIEWITKSHTWYRKGNHYSYFGMNLPYFPFSGS